MAISVGRTKIRKQVRFSDFAGYKFVSTDFNEEDFIQNEFPLSTNCIHAAKVSQEINGEIQRVDVLQSSDTLQGLQPNRSKRLKSRLEFQAVDFPFLRMGDPVELFEPTKQQDGAGQATLITFALVTKLVANGSIHKSEISDFFQIQQDHKKPIANADLYHTEAESGQSAASCGMPQLSTVIIHTDRQPFDHQLCRSVQSKLFSLSSRITRQGRAILQPSTNIMGKQFVPALVYLQDLLQDLLLQPTVEQKAGILLGTWGPEGLMTQRIH